MNEQTNGFKPQLSQSPSPSSPAAPASSSSAQSGTQPSKKKRRALYRAGRVSVSAAAREAAGPDE